MSENVGSIYYVVEARVDGLLAAERTANDSMDRMTGQMGRTDRQADRLNSTMSKLALAIKAVAFGAALREAAGMVQRYQEMAERIRMATDSQEEYINVQERLMATANGTYRSLSEAQELYIRTADSLRAMSYSTQQAMDVQDSMSYSFVKNATSADRAGAAISAVTKSLNTNKVAADQWETITSAIPSIIDDIAASSGKSSAEIRRLGAAGKLAGTDLSEGLRKSLEANTKAAADMSTNMIDAGVRTKTAITSVLVSLEEQTGALQSLTDGIISAADAMLGFSQDSASMEQVLNAATIAAGAFASVMVGRIITSIYTYTAAQISAVAATINKVNSDNLAAAAALRRTGVEKQLAMTMLATAQAEFNAARGTNAHTFALEALTAARMRAITATEAHRKAQAAVSSATTASTIAMGGLRTAMGFLGGPAGVIMLAATAIYAFGNASQEAKPPVDLLTDSINELGDANLRLLKTRITDKLEELKGLGASAQTSAGSIEYLKKQLQEFPNSAKAGEWKRRLEEQEAAAETAGAELENYKKRLEEVNDELSGRRTGNRKSTDQEAAPTLIGPANDKAADKLQKEADRQAKAIRERIEDLELEASMLGMTATETELYKLQLAGATDEQIRAAATSLALVDAYSQQQKAADEAAAAEDRRKRAFGDDAKSASEHITGNPAPLSGGPFDNQFARFKAEEEAEQKRYQASLERLQTAKELEIKVIGGYQALEEQMAQTHASRMAQIEEAKNNAMLSSGKDLFGGLADAAKQYAGESSSLYKAMFAASKAFSIAQATMAISSGIAQAANNPWPTNLAAMASVAAATAGLVSDISSVSMGGGRQYGGPASADKMYRINETGAPEVFQSANGQQYMLPNTRGQVVANGDAGGSGITNIITINVGADGNTSVDSGNSSQDSVAMAQAIKTVTLDEIERQSRPGGLIWKQFQGQN